MVLARALASRRATITIRHQTFLTTRTRPRHQCASLVPVGSTSGRRYYAAGAEDDTPAARQERLIDALASLTEAQRVAEVGKPEERKTALAQIAQANAIISVASNLQRRRAQAVLTQEIEELKRGKPSDRLARLASTSPVDSGDGVAGKSVTTEKAPERLGADTGKGEVVDPVHTVQSDATVTNTPNGEAGKKAVANPVQAGAVVTEVAGSEDRGEAASRPALDSASTDSISNGFDSGTSTSDASYSTDHFATQSVSPTTNSILNGLDSGTSTSDVSYSTDHFATQAVSPTTNSISNGLDNGASTSDASYSTDRFATRPISPTTNSDSNGVDSGASTSDASDSTDHLATRPVRPATKPRQQSRPLVRYSIVRNTFDYAEPDDPVKWVVLPPFHGQFRQLSEEEQSRLLLLRRRERALYIRKVDKVWLRNACSCTSCVDPVTGWKAFNITSVPETLPTKTVRFNQTTGDLEVEWQDDFLTKSTHLSVYPKEILEYFNKPKNLARARVQSRLLTQHRELWNANKIKQHPLRSLDYPAFEERTSDFKLALESLHNQGLLLIKKSDQVDLERLVRIIGPAKNTHWGMSWDVGHDPLPRFQDRPDSGCELHPATCEPWIHAMPRMLFLQCLENTVAGGSLILVDGMKAAYDMHEFDSPNFKALSLYKFRYSFKGVGVDGESVNFRSRRPAFILHRDDSIIVRTNQRAMATDPLHLPDSADEYDQARRALKAFTERIEDPANRIVYKMQKGDTMVIDTWRILLGRNAFDPTSGSRHFRAAVITDEDWMSSVIPLNALPGTNNLGDIPVAMPYELQVWSLAGKDPADRPVSEQWTAGNKEGSMTWGNASRNETRSPINSEDAGPASVQDLGHTGPEKAGKGAEPWFGSNGIRM